MYNGLMETDLCITYLRRVELSNIRGFHRLDLDFGGQAEPPRMHTVVVGRNGTCKTTLLRAIALALATEQDVGALLSAPNGRWITEGSTNGIIRLHLESMNGGGPSIRQLELVDGSSGEVAHFKVKPVAERSIFIGAYGTGRGQVGGEPGRGYRVMDSVATLFRYEERLVHSELVLRRLHDFLGWERFEATLDGLKRALALGPEHSIELPPGGGVTISGPDLGGRIPLEGWADGYRMTFSWMIDFFGWAMRAGAFDSEGEIAGILLIDELEQHLHPAMQRDLLGQLARALPRVQILSTTHSPLVALAAHPEQIVSLHRHGPLIESCLVPNLDGYTADDVLVEETLFGTDPYSSETRQRLERQQELARIPPEARSPAQAAELQRLAACLDPRDLPSLRGDPVVSQLAELKALLNNERSDP